MASTSGIRSRGRDKIFLIDYPAHQITGCKLPSNRQVLATMFYNLRTVKLNVRDSATTTVDQVLVFWTKARIPTKQKKNVIVKLEKLYDDWRKMQKYKDRKTESARNAVKEFTVKLDDLFDIAHQDALTMMTSVEDKEFLLKQRQKGRPGSMLGVDLKLAQAEERLQQKQRKVLDKQLEAGNLDMADVEKKSRGRPGKAAKKEEQVDSPPPKDAKKRGRPTPPTKENRDTSIKESKNDTNGEVPAKRGRGRPPKKGGAAYLNKVPTGRGRGRPPNKKKESEAEESEDEKPADAEDAEEEEEDEEENEESS